MHSYGLYNPHLALPVAFSVIVIKAFAVSNMQKLKKKSPAPIYHSGETSNWRNVTLFVEDARM